MRAILAAAFVLTACASVDAPSAPNALSDNAAVWLAEQQVASVAIAAIEDGEVAWTAAYGERAPGRSARTDTLYNVASLAKPVSAEIMLRLASMGDLDLDAPMSRYWVDPDLAADPRRDALTLRVALSHRTGFANWRRMTGGVLRFERAPGQTFTYSGEGYEYARRYVSRAVGEDFEVLAERNVFAPIGMHDTTYTSRPWLAARMALPYLESGDVGEPSINERGEMLASDDLYTTVADYARFVIAVMNHEGLSDEIAQQRFQYDVELRDGGCGPQGLAEEVCPDGVGMGLGWMVLRYGDQTVMSHSGSDVGEQTLAFFIPEQRRGLVVFTNSANGRKIFPLVAEIVFPSHPYNALLRLQAR
ncbi:MAG: beta-lactamase family protein [Hyphomonadaceae bacterium]|nr:beta-lactamase family protein [Hyphomonadaceae bacterium]